jgi:UPF0716 protein FxsA
MFGYWFILLAAMPFVELYLLFKMGCVVGVVNTLAFLILTGIFGAALAKSQGRIIIGQIFQSLQEAKLPPDRLLNSLFVLMGGVFLILPGLLCDAIGMLLVVPFTRRLLIMMLKGYLQNKINSGQHVNLFFYYNQGFPLFSGSSSAGGKRSFASENVIDAIYEIQDESK